MNEVVNFDKQINKNVKHNLIEIQRNISLDFVAAQSFEKPIIELAKKEIALGVNDFLLFESNTRIHQKHTILDSLMLGISVEAQHKLDAIFEIMEDSDKNLSSLKSRINLIEESIQILNIDEQFIILSTASIAKHTLSYWSENYEDWIILMNNSGNSSRLQDIDWKAAGKADVGGAALAGLGLVASGTGAAMAATGPAGWAGIGLVVAGRGMQSSAFRMLLDLW